MFNIKNIEKFLLHPNKQKIPAKKSIFVEGDSSKEILFILTGSIRVFTVNEEGLEVTLSIRGKGEMIGLYSILLDEKHKASAETLEDSTVFKINKNVFKRIINSSSQLSFEVLTYLAYEIRQENKYLKRIMTDNLENRTLKTIKRLSKLSKNGSVHLSHEQLSSIIGATRPRITETLHKLERKGKLVRSPKKGLHLIKLRSVIKIPVN